MKKLSTLACLVILTGCASVTHTRTSTVGTNGVPIVTETEKAHAFLMKGGIDKLAISTTDGAYKHTVDSSGAQGAGDVDVIKALTATIGQIAGTAAAAAAGKP